MPGPFLISCNGLWLTFLSKLFTFLNGRECTSRCQCTARTPGWRITQWVIRGCLWIAHHDLSFFLSEHSIANAIVWYFMNTPHLSHTFLHISFRALRATQTILHSYTPHHSQILKTFPRSRLAVNCFESMRRKERRWELGFYLTSPPALFTSHLFVWLDLRFPGWEWGIHGQIEVLRKVQLQGTIILRKSRHDFSACEPMLNL